MALVTRTLSNAADPLLAPDGTVLSGVEVKFQLVDVNGAPTKMFDGITGEAVSGAAIVTTNLSGVFSVNLWPNDRGVSSSFYKCSTNVPGFSVVQSIVPSGVGTYTWRQFHG